MSPGSWSNIALSKPLIGLIYGTSLLMFATVTYSLTSLVRVRAVPFAVQQCDGHGEALLALSRELCYYRLHFSLDLFCQLRSSWGITSTTSDASLSGSFN